MIKDMDFQTTSVKLLVRDLGGISVAWDDSRVLVLSPLPQGATITGVCHYTGSPNDFSLP